MTVELQRLTAPRAATVLALELENRRFLDPYMPLRDETYFTEFAIAQRIAVREAERARGVAYAYLVVADGEVAGTLNLNDVIRGPFQSAHLGYWVAQTHNGRGIATAAVNLAVAEAFGSLGLHRLQAATLVHNRASQRVLEKNGFREIGTALGYLCIAGEWQDHVLFERITP